MDFHSAVVEIITEQTCWQSFQNQTCLLRRKPSKTRTKTKRREKKNKKRRDAKPCWSPSVLTAIPNDVSPRLRFCGRSMLILASRCQREGREKEEEEKKNPAWL